MQQAWREHLQDGRCPLGKAMSVSDLALNVLLCLRLLCDKARQTLWLSNGVMIDRSLKQTPVRHASPFNCKGQSLSA